MFEEMLDVKVPYIFITRHAFNYTIMGWSIYLLNDQWSDWIPSGMSIIDAKVAKASANWFWVRGM